VNKLEAAMPDVLHNVVENTRGLDGLELAGFVLLSAFGAFGVCCFLAGSYFFFDLMVAKKVPSHSSGIVAVIGTMLLFAGTTFALGAYAALITAYGG
jgi:hypothetical protein